MNCKDCQFWQGNKYSEYGDCYRVIFEIEPSLKACKATEGPYVGVSLWNPLDPHDLQWFNKNGDLRKLLRNLKKNLPDGVRVQKVGKQEYFQTRKDFECTCHMNLKQ